MAIGGRGAVFLDRDGVVISEKDFIADPTKLEFISGSIEAIKLIPSHFLKIIISNQSGIGRGYFSTAQVESFNTHLLRELEKNGAFIDEIYYCPHKPEDNCNCRKPRTGLFEQAKKKFSIDFAKSWVVGDKSSDILAGKNIAARTVLVLTGYGGNEKGGTDSKPDYMAKNLLEAVELIAK